MAGRMWREVGMWGKIKLFPISVTPITLGHTSLQVQLILPKTRRGLHSEH